MNISMDPVYTPPPETSPSTPSIQRRAAGFMRAHWKAIGVVALGLLALRSKRLRPLAKTAASAYLIPTARHLLARARA